jgi:uncharacterized membrane protein YphA (DoxX/SURF4 family)
MYRISAATVVMLVALRLAIGWHFYMEGLEKHQSGGEFSSAGFLRQAKGPLADFFLRFVPDFHQHDRLLGRPILETPDCPADAEGVPGADMFPPDAPYYPWAHQIMLDWRTALQGLIEHAGLSDEQRQAAGKALEARMGELREYLAEQNDQITAYRQELARLAQLEAHPGAGSLPFVDERAAVKHAEVARMPGEWIGGVEAIERGFYADLRSLLDEAQITRAAPSFSAPDRLATIDKVVTYGLVAIGACLIVGLFTRTAALAGALFLLSVIATQPPWISGLTPMYKEVAEMISLLTLATTRVGRWGGLDFFVHALWQGCCGTKERTS